MLAGDQAVGAGGDDAGAVLEGGGDIDALVGDVEDLDGTLGDDAAALARGDEEDGPEPASAFLEGGKRQPGAGLMAVACSIPAVESGTDFKPPFIEGTAFIKVCV